MAETTKKETNFDLREKVPVYVPRGAGDQLITGNKKNWLLPEGQTSYVPRAVQLEYLRSEHAKDRLAAEMEKRQQQSQK